MIGNDWDNYLQEEYTKPYFQELLSFVDDEYHHKTIYPKKNEIFNAFRYTPYEKVKVVILGQDPYHGYQQAQGLSFSVRDGIPKPPSLQNIFKELHDDIGCPIPTTSSLIPWADQGVLLLNSVLTVEANKAASHKGRGWEIFTDEVISILNNKDTPVVFILWGGYARSKKKLITNPLHYIVESAHPSPLSAYNGFFGSKPFSKTNEFLIAHHDKPINWSLQ
mgnify:FL=1